MIAEIQDPFVGEALNRKIDYQLKKIESGVARELYNSSGDSLINMYRNECFRALFFSIHL